VRKVPTWVWIAGVAVGLYGLSHAGNSKKTSPRRVSSAQRTTPPLNNVQPVSIDVVAAEAERLGFPVTRTELS